MIFAAPFAAGDIFDTAKIRNSGLAFIAFCFVASAGYIINDLCDVERDRKNSRKSHRPIAARSVNPKIASAISFVFLATGLAVATFLPLAFVITITAYFLITLAYTVHFKNEPVVELMLVSLGFALRAIGGANATGTPTSQWFLMVATFGPLVIVTSKRISEGVNVPFEDRRPVMKKYSPAFLNFVLSVAASVTMTSYGLWAFSLSEPYPFAEISLLPMSIQLFRYVWRSESGAGEVPEDLIFRDRISVICMFAIVVLLALSVYVKA